MLGVQPSAWANGYIATWMTGHASLLVGAGILVGVGGQAGIGFIARWGLSHIMAGTTTGKILTTGGTAFQLLGLGATAYAAWCGDMHAQTALANPGVYGAATLWNELGGALSGAARTAFRNHPYFVRQRPFITNKQLNLTGLNEHEIRAALARQGGWTQSSQTGFGYEGQPRWYREIDGLVHEIRIHPTATRTNRNIGPGMAAYEGPVSRYGVQVVRTSQPFRKPEGFNALVDPIPDDLKPLYNMDRYLRSMYGDQSSPMKGGWNLHYVDPYGFAYVNEEGYLIGVATEHGHMLAQGHPWLLTDEEWWLWSIITSEMGEP